MIHVGRWFFLLHACARRPVTRENTRPVGKVVSFQLPLNLPQKPSASHYRRRLGRARTVPEIRALAEEIIRDYDFELERLNARCLTARAVAEEIGAKAICIARILHD